MPVRDETIDRALNAKTKTERDAAIKAMLREWITTMPPAEKEKMIREMADGTVRLMRGLMTLRDAAVRKKGLDKRRKRS